MDDKAPVFVKIDEYRSITKLLDQVRAKLNEARDLLHQVSELKRQEDEELDTWAKELEDVEERLNSIDKALLEPQL